MTQMEVINIVKESKLWELLSKEEKQEAIKHAFKITQLSPTEEEIRIIVGEVYSESK